MKICHKERRWCHAEEFEEVPEQQTHIYRTTIHCPLELPPVLAIAKCILSAYFLQRYS